jgi:general secretion pathway protein D
VAEKIIESNDKAKAELLVDVELLEINRSTLQTLGINLSSQTAGLTFQGPTGGVPLNNLQLLRQSGNWVLGPIPGVTLDFLRSDSDTKVIAKPQMRVTEGEKANIHIGDRVPIPTTTFNTSNTVGGNVVPITSFVYQEIGIIIDIEPRVHHNKEVTMKLRVEVSALGPSISTGSGQSQPTIQSREIETVIRLRDGETNLLAGLIQEVEQESTSGVAGISKIPILKRIFSRNNKDRRATDIVLTLTPHIIRIPDIRDEDLKALWIGTEQNIQLSGASRQSAFGAGPFAAAEEEAGEGEEPEEGVAPPEGTQEGQPPAAPEAPPAGESAAAQTAQPAAGPPPPPGVTVAQPQALEQPPAAVQPPPAAEAEPSPQSEAPPAEPPAQPQFVEIAVTVEPVPASLAVGGRTMVEIQVAGAENLHSAAVTLVFDPAILKFENGSEGDLLNAGGAATAFSMSAAGGNRVAVSVARVSDTTGVTGSGRIATLVFSGVAPGSSPMSIESASFQDPAGRPINATLSSPPAIVVQ